MNQQKETNQTKSQSSSQKLSGSQQSQSGLGGGSTASSSGGTSMGSSTNNASTSQNASTSAPVASQSASKSGSQGSSQGQAQTQDQSNTPSTQGSHAVSERQNAIMEPIVKFEDALVGFADTLGKSRHNIEHVVDLALQSKDELIQIKDAFLPYVSNARGASDKVVTRVRANPKPIIWTFAGILGSFLVWNFFQGRSTDLSSKAKLH